MSIVQNLRSKGKLPWLKLAILAIIFVFGLTINKVLFHHLPLGEDGMYYLGTIRRIFDFKVDQANWMNIHGLIQGKFLLFYIFGWLWSVTGHLVSFFTYFNLVFVLFYLLAYLSFLRLVSLRSKSFYTKLIGALLFTLLPSSTIWLGPIYFVPSLWLYISLPNIIVSGYKKRYIELLFWVVINYFFYSYGFQLGLLVAAITLIFTLLESWSVVYSLVFSALLWLLYYFFGIHYADSFVKTYAASFGPEVNISILPILFKLYILAGFSTFFYILIKRDKRSTSLWFIGAVLAGIFYVLVGNYPDQMPIYRFIPIFYFGLALLLSFISDISLIKNNNLLRKALYLLVTIILLFISVKLCLWKVDQYKYDQEHQAITSQEIKVFNQANEACQDKKCLVVTDIGTYTVGRYFSPSIFGGLASYTSHLLEASQGPSALRQVAKKNNDDLVVMIISKRTVELYEASNTSPLSQVSRSYNLDMTDPEDKFVWLKQYSSYVKYQEPGIGLYYFKIPIESLGKFNK